MCSHTHIHTFTPYCVNDQLHDEQGVHMLCWDDTSICRANIYRQIISFGHGLNHRHFADCIFKYFSLYEDYNVLILISLKFVYNGAICNMLPSVQIVVSHQTGSSHYLNQYWPMFYEPLCRRPWAPNELTHLPLVPHIYVRESGQHWFRLVRLFGANPLS